jgi:hypothetical protein
MANSNLMQGDRVGASCLRKRSLHARCLHQHLNNRRQARPNLIFASVLRQLALTAAGAAALGATAVILQKRQQQRGYDSSPTPKRDGGAALPVLQGLLKSAEQLAATAAGEPRVGLSWPLASKEQQLLNTVRPATHLPAHALMLLGIIRCSPIA